MSPYLKQLFFASAVFIVSFSFAAAQTEQRFIDRTYQFKFQTQTDGGPAAHVEFIFALPDDVSVINQDESVRFDGGLMYLRGPEVMEPGDAWEQQFTLRGSLDTLSVLESTPLPFIWRDDFFVSEGAVDLSTIIVAEVEAPGIIRRVRSAIVDLRANPRVVKQVKQVAVPVSVTLGAVGVGVLTTTAASSSAPFAFNLLQLFRFLALGFLRFERRKPWGRIYSELTGNPVAGATVRIYDTQFKKVKETQTTDRDGRFGFLVTPGNYFLQIVKSGFAVAETEAMRIADPKEVLTMEIALKSDAPEMTERSLRLLKALNTVKSAFDLVNPYLFVFGTGLSVFIAVVVPTAFNYGVLGLYFALDTVKIILARWSLKSFGTVADVKLKIPLPLTVVRAFDTHRSWLLGTRVTDDLGRFNFLLMPGSYYVSCAKTGYKPYQSKSVVLKKSGIIAFDVQMERLR